MKLFACLLFAVSAAAAVIHVRDLSSVAIALARVQNSIKAFNEFGKKFNGDQQPIVDVSNDLIDKISSGIVIMNKSGLLRLSDTAALLSVVKTLVDNAWTLVMTIKANVPAIAEAKACALA